ncbi:type IV pilus assembly protein PilM [Vibrio sp.]|uniref:type IV pilus assembly protein PilM n=1 Tax=Vibrio sp. TaxID=678 RepID=UPI003D096948
MGFSLITGLDIGHHSIKALVIKPNKQGITLAGYQQLSMETDIFSDNCTLNHQKIVKKLKELRKALPPFSRKVAISVADKLVISKVIQIDSELDPSEHHFAILQAFGRQAPVEVEQLALDYQRLPDQEPVPRWLNYQVYATRKGLIDSSLDWLRQAGWQPQLLDCASHGLMALLVQASRTYSTLDWALCDIDQHQARLCAVLPGGQSYYKSWSLPPSNADALEDIEPVASRLEQQLQLLRSVHSRLSGGVWLTGNYARLDRLAQRIHRSDRPCQRLDPFELFPLAKKLQVPSAGAGFSIAAGIALRGLNWQEHSHGR